MSSALAGFLLVLTATAGTISGASAAAGVAQTKTSATAKSVPAATSGTDKTAPEQVRKPVQPDRQSSPTAATSAQRAAGGAAVRDAIAHSTVPDTCSGAIDPDTVYPCSTPSSSGTDAFTVTLSSASDLLVVQALALNGAELLVSITPPGGTATSCQPVQYGMLPQCATSGAGTYTVQVQNDGVDYTLSYLPVESDSTCTTADPSFATTTALQGTVAAGSAGACFTLDIQSGHVLHVEGTPNGGGVVTVYDSTGATICVDDSGDCTLTGVGPYRAVDNYPFGGASTYAYRFDDITSPTGCAAAAQVAYGATPDTSAQVLCRTLTVATAGNYQIYAVSPALPGASGTLYTPAGAAACTNSGPFCQLAAGTYDYVLSEDPASTVGIGVVFLAASESRGCTAAGDTGFQSGDATGTFAGQGIEACVTVPTASGKSDYVYQQFNTDGTEGFVEFVVDSTGAQQCSSANFGNLTVCALTGTAPFRVVLAPGYQNNAGTKDTAYRVLIQRTDSTAGCAVWPQSGYGGSYGATVALTTASNLGCLSIPATQHATGEMIDWYNNANTVDGSINVYDPTGTQVCASNSTVICSYKSGVAYTALVYFAGSPTVKSDTFRVVRRDVTASAPCSAPASTTVGGASTAINLTSDIYAVCEHVTAAATDQLYFDVRAQSPYKTGAVLEVANAAGTIVCRQWGTTACAVTGSTAYQAIVIASGYNGVTIAAHLDALRVGTSSGWASQCTAHPVSANGWLTPLTGTLSESASSYCAVVAIQPSQRWNVYGADTATADESPMVRMYSTQDWTQSNILCSGGISIGCIASSNDSGQAVMIVTLGSVQGTTGFSFQGVCQLGCPSQPGFPAIASVSAASQPQGAAETLVVHGTNLNLGTDLDVMSNDATASGYSVSTPSSVSADGTTATYSLNTLNVAPGKYDLGVATGSTPFCANGQASAQCLYGAYTVTAGRGANSTFVALPTKRIMDTRSGLGVRKGTIAAGGTVPLTVVGVGGVPSSGVTAVEVDLTSLDQTLGGYVTAYPYGSARPNASDLNFGANQVLTNLATVPVAQGKIQLYNGAAGTIDLIVDVVGYFTTSTSGSLYTAVTPTRIVNTAAGLGAAKAKVAAHGSLTVTVAGAGGVPATGVTAVALDVTASGSAGNGYLVSYAPGGTVPAGTDVTYRTGQAHTGLIVVPLVQGKFVIYNGGPQPVDLAMDVEGYYAPGTGSGFQPVGPVRVLDDRSGLGGAGATPVPAGGVAMLPYSSLTGVPNTATAVVLDVVIVAPQTTGTLTVTVDGQPLPGLANLSYPQSKLTADQIVVPVGSKLDFFNSSGGTVQVVADLQGYYTS